MELFSPRSSDLSQMHPKALCILNHTQIQIYITLMYSLHHQNVMAHQPSLFKLFLDILYCEQNRINMWVWSTSDVVTSFPKQWELIDSINTV